MADQSSGGGGGGSAAAVMSGSGSGMREYRKGNWTLQETMILIEAKKMDEERRLKRTSTTATLTTPTSASASKAVGELRWKWVEDYCWRRGCFRSQNQCNDKWDNLMRDYKKVRDYQRNLILNNNQQEQSYWNMEKSDRKERGLPSNMLPTIYDALVQVVEKKSSSSASPSPSPASASASALLPPLPTTTTSTDVQPKATTSGALSLLLQQQQQMSATLALPPSQSQPPSFSSQPLIIPSTLLYQTATTTKTVGIPAPP